MLEQRQQGKEEELTLHHPSLLVLAFLFVLKGFSGKSGRIKDSGNLMAGWYNVRQERTRGLQDKQGNLSTSQGGRRAWFSMLTSASVCQLPLRVHGNRACAKAQPGQTNQRGEKVCFSSFQRAALKPAR